jgi:hypothetical protein
VIRLMHLHGVNNSFDTGGSSFVAHHSPLGTMSIPNTEFGDLEIMQVNQAEHDEAACGPKFHVTIRNNSTRKVCNFHVSMVAVLGRICPTSPNATVKVGEICPGAALEVCVQLPIEALAMGNRNGQVIGYQRLVVAIDSFDELVETNEANNLKAFACSEIPVVSTVVEETTETTVTSPAATVTEETRVETNAAPGNIGNAGNAGTAPVQATPSSADPLRSAIRMLDTTSSETSSSL